MPEPGPCPRCRSIDPPVETIVDTGEGALAQLKCASCGFTVVAADTDVSGMSVRLATATYAVMRHVGYTVEELTAAEAVTCEQSGCEMVPGVGYDHSDEDGESRHPVLDEINVTAEILRVGFEAIGVEL